MKLTGHGGYMKSTARGRDRAATLSNLGFHPVKTQRYKLGSFKVDPAARRRKNKGIRHFANRSGLEIALRTSGAWRLCNKKGRRGRGHTLYELESLLATLKK
jgi:hypothetical protein